MVAVRETSQDLERWLLHRGCRMTSVRYALPKTELGRTVMVFQKSKECAKSTEHSGKGRREGLKGHKKR